MGRVFRTGRLELSLHQLRSPRTVGRALVKGGVRLKSTFRLLRARGAGRARFGEQLIPTWLGLMESRRPLRGGPQVRPRQTRLQLVPFQLAASRGLRLSLAPVRKDAGGRRVRRGMEAMSGMEMTLLS